MVKIKFLEGKTTSERNKLIAAALLGVLALFALWFAFLRGSSSSTSVSVNANLSAPRAGASPANPNRFTLPTAEEQDLNSTTIPIVYNPAMAGAPDPGRNIFAFYEPPPPCPTCPTPYRATPPPETPKPTPTPAYLVSGMNPQSLYAGSRSFRLEVYGDRFTPDAKIFISQQQYPTTYVSPQQLVTEVPANMISTEGQRQIIVQSSDGTKYSDQAMLMVQAPPRPQFQYIGMIGRKRYNNDTAYFIETGKTIPIAGRLNDVLGGRFRLVSINSSETVFEDTGLGFKHRLTLVKAAAGGQSSPGLPPPTGARGFPAAVIPSADPSFQSNPVITQGEIPGIPSNIPRYVPPQAANRQPTDKKDVDDDDPR